MSDGRKMEMISVIIPAYNAEKRIAQCLDSVILQEGVNLEVLIIDDGSSDETLSICRAYEKKYSFCRVIRQKNSGVSVARNTGLENCNGKWIVFVDADDELEPGTLQKAQQLAESKQCDTVCWNGLYQKNDTAKPMNPFRLPSNQIEKHGLHLLWESLYHLTTDDIYTGDYFRACWGKLLSANVIQKSKLRFPTGMKIGEDAVFLFSYFHLCQKVWMEDCCWYRYFVSDVSATGRYRASLPAEQHFEYKRVRQMFQQYGEDPEFMAVRFWHLAYPEFLQNEQKSGVNCLMQAKRGNEYIKDKTVKYYLKRFDRKEIGAIIRTILIRIGLGRLAVFLDVLKIHRKAVAE